MAGPVGIVLAILLWASLQAVGWALVYYPQVPQGFTYAASVDPSRYTDFFEVLYISMVTLSTLGFGDVIAVNPWIRVLSPVEALTGFALLTAAVSWFMQIYPALARRRALAIHLAVLKDSQYLRQLGQFSSETVSRTLEGLTNDVIQVRVDLTQTGESYGRPTTTIASCSLGNPPRMAGKRLVTKAR